MKANTLLWFGFILFFTTHIILTYVSGSEWYENPSMNKMLLISFIYVCCIAIGMAMVSFGIIKTVDVSNKEIKDKKMEARRLCLMKK